MIARFSNLAGEIGTADHERDVRGFALKFYTEEGNWDLVGTNSPVFFLRAPHKFPNFIRTQKPHPRTNLRSATAMWGFWSLAPGCPHQVTMLFSVPSQSSLSSKKKLPRLRVTPQDWHRSRRGNDRPTALS